MIEDTVIHGWEMNGGTPVLNDQNNKGLVQSKSRYPDNAWESERCVLNTSELMY